MAKETPSLYRRTTKDLSITWPVKDGVKHWEVHISIDGGVSYILHSTAQNMDDRFAFSQGSASWLGGVNQVFHIVSLASLVPPLFNPALQEGEPVFVKLKSVDAAGVKDPVSLTDVDPLVAWVDDERNRDEGEQRDPNRYKEFRGTITHGTEFADKSFDILKTLGRAARVTEIETDQRILVKFNSLGNDSMEIKTSEERRWATDDLREVRIIFMENNDGSFTSDAKFRIWVSA